MSWPLYGVCTYYYNHKLHWSDMHCAGNIYLSVTLLTKSAHLTMSFVLVFLCSCPCYCFLQLSHRFDMLTHTSLDKHRKNCKKLPWELVGCQGVKVFLLKDVILTSSVTTVIFITITIWVFERFEFFSLVTIWSFKFCHNLFFWVLLQFEFLSFATI